MEGESPESTLLDSVSPNVRFGRPISRNGVKGKL